MLFIMQNVKTNFMSTLCAKRPNGRSLLPSRDDLLPCLAITLVTTQKRDVSRFLSSRGPAVYPSTTLMVDAQRH
jgi:hypothetical protein